MNTARNLALISGSQLQEYLFLFDPMLDSEMKELKKYRCPTNQEHFARNSKKDTVTTELLKQVKFFDEYQGQYAKHNRDKY
ncbi:hypothetical protein A0J61_03106 [Choanephora cucurbitarum]|uniref:Uncharacterized protein n=1 Tax=Choanephora cucurbitarum TaxID=101091 RepID=A0A1C7NI74_9FUNG|nr:hypothetical protein A0J61_03106 [Choanephora cucurbitarum]